MRILIYYGKSPGGTERYFSSLGGLLSSRGNTVTILSEGKGIDIRSLLLKPPKLASILRRIDDFDVVLTGGILGRFFSGVRIPIIVPAFHVCSRSYLKKYCSTWKRLYYKIAIEYPIRETYKRSDAIIAISRFVKRFLQDEFKEVEEDKIHVLYPGLDLEKFTTVEKTTTKKEDINLLFVGNLIKRKGADLLPKILDLLPTNYYLRYIGGRRATKKIRHKRAIRVNAPTDKELVREYQNCDIFLFPTRIEGFGYVVAEAMACGMPVISTNVSSIPELVLDKKGGFLCDRDDVRGYAYFAKKLGNAHELRYKMGNFNRIRAKQFGNDRFANGITKILEESISK